MQRTRRRSAFTIIELAVAVTITVVLAAIAIPRYNDFSRKQQFLSEVQTAMGCIQEAQRIAASPPAGSSSRWIAADMSNANGNCRVLRFDATVTQASLTDTLPAPQEVLDTVATPDLVYALATSRIYFGVLEHGVPTRYTYPGGYVQSNLGNGVRQPDGTSIAVTINWKTDPTVTTQVAIEPSGAPLHILNPIGAGTLACGKGLC